MRAGRARAPLPVRNHLRVRRDTAAPPVRVVSCQWCSAPLADQRGNPRWHITAQWEFVCLLGCVWPMKPSVAGVA